MNKHKLITIHVHSLAQLAPLDKTNFADIRSYNHYKKEQIYVQRSQYLSHHLNTEIQNEDVISTEFGKPYLKNYPELNFNHSHSQKNYALAFSHSIQDVGVDVEDLDRKVRFDALAKHAFHPKELAVWNNLEQEKEYWFKVWTTKEAVLKAAGLGIRINLNEFDTQVHAEQNGGVCYHPEIGTFAYQNYQLAHVILTVAWRSEHSCKGFNLPQIHIHQH